MGINKQKYSFINYFSRQLQGEIPNPKFPFFLPKIRALIPFSPLNLKMKNGDKYLDLRRFSSNSQIPASFSSSFPTGAAFLRRKNDFLFIFYSLFIPLFCSLVIPFFPSPPIYSFFILFLLIFFPFPFLFPFFPFKSPFPPFPPFLFLFCPFLFSPPLFIPF